MTHESSEPIVWMGVGIPGSGKTTELKKFAEEIGAVYLCADDFREVISGDAANQRVTPEAWDLVHRHASLALGEGQSVVIDGTFAKQIDRVESVKRYRNSGAATIVALCFEIDVDTAEQRIAGRDRKVPRFVLERMLRELEQNPVSRGDGFDVIINANDVDTQTN